LNEVRGTLAIPLGKENQGVLTSSLSLIKKEDITTSISFRYPLRSRKIYGSNDVGVVRGLGKDGGKENEILMRGRKCYIYVAQNKSLWVLIEGKELTLKGELRSRQALDLVTKC